MGMFDKAVWAVVGNHATNPIARNITQHLKTCGKEVTAITPKNGERITNVNGLEVVNMVVNPKAGKDVLQDAIDMDVKSVWFQPGSCSQELRDMCNTHGITFHEGCVLVELHPSSL